MAIMQSILPSLAALFRFNYIAVNVNHIRLDHNTSEIMKVWLHISDKMELSKTAC